MANNSKNKKKQILFGPFGPVWWCDLYFLLVLLDLFGAIFNFDFICSFCIRLVVLSLNFICSFLFFFGSTIFIFDPFGPICMVCFTDCNNKYANLSSAL